MEGGRFSHSWCMCVYGNWYGGLVGGRDGGGGWYVCGQIPGIGRMTGNAGALS